MSITNTSLLGSSISNENYISPRMEERNEELKWAEKMIGLIPLEENLNINNQRFIEDLHFQSLQNQSGWERSIYFKAPSSIEQPLCLKSIGLIFLKTAENTCSCIGSGLSLNELKILLPLSKMPEGIRSQMEMVYSIIEQKMKLFFQKEFQEKRNYELFKQQIHAMPTLGPTIELTNTATEEICREAIMVNEHAYAIASFFKHSPVVMGTMEIATCIGLVAINKEKKLIGVTHLDLNTIDVYRDSLSKMFNQMQATPQQPMEIYLIGGSENVKSSFFDDLENISQTLALSLKEFIESRKDGIIQGIRLFKENEDLDFIVKISPDSCEFFSISDANRALLYKNMAKLELKNHIYGKPINYRELVEIQLLN